MEYHLFTIKAVEFQHGQRDPFGFENYAEKIAQDYIPFSGTIRKPIYLLFIAYVNMLLKKGLISAKTKKEMDEVKVRLEKLLVTIWKQNNTTLRGQSVIGSSIRHINPFTGCGGDWVVQNCFEIYDASVSEFNLDELVEKYHHDNLDQLHLLIDFLKRSGSRDNNQRYLERLMDGLRRKKNSLFSGQMLLSPRYRIIMFRLLKDRIKSHKFGQDSLLIKGLSNSPQKAEAILTKVLNSSKYPFHKLNLWFCTFTQAVDATINGKEASFLWRKADDLFRQIEQKVGVSKRPRCKCWFDWNISRYQKNKSFDKDAWSALLRRSKTSDHLYTSFRITALSSLLKELSNNAK
jgi:hypothetical protein